MRLLVGHWDMRGGYQAQEAWTTQVIDEDTGNIVGSVHHQRSPALRFISLFGGKYEAEFSSGNSQSECDAFAKGVEAVLNHIVAIPDESRSSGE